MKNLLIRVVVCCVFASFGGIALAQGPVVNIDSRRHGNLAAAQSYIVQAYRRINQAQGANSDALGGPAQRAKQLLTQADSELRAAANVANQTRR